MRTLQVIPIPVGMAVSLSTKNRLQTYWTQSCFQLRTHRCGGNGPNYLTSPRELLGSMAERIDPVPTEIQHVCKCNVDQGKSDLTKLSCFS